MHTTNYFDTFIEIAEDSPAGVGAIPPLRGESKTIAHLEYELIAANPYKYTSDDVLFQVYATRHSVATKDAPTERQRLFSKGQPCLRSSPLTKRYGWGIHSDSHGKVALYPVESAAYQNLKADTSVKHVKAMRSKR